VGLRLTTPRLELRRPSPEELGALAELATEGIHDPEVMPFAVPRPDQPPAETARSVIQHRRSSLRLYPCTLFAAASRYAWVSVSMSSGETLWAVVP
jgi:hypothetical protein